MRNSPQVTEKYSALRRAVAVVTAAAAVGQSPSAFSELEEVIVTANRRDQSMLDIPYNISAVTADQLESLNVTDFSKLTRIVPGLQLTDRGIRDNSTSARLVMRGINTENAAFADVPFVTASPVATYIDETPVFANLRMYDIERVEVLRGPQGTLYGSGSLGGTVRYLHRKPQTDQLEGSVDISASSTADAGDENYSIAGNINLPLSERFSARLSGGRDHYAGFIDAKRLALLNQDGSAVLADPASPLTSLPVYGSRDDVNEAEATFFRGSLLANITDSLSIQLSYHTQKQEADHRDAQSIGVPGIGDRETAVTLLEPGESELDLYSMDIEADFGFATVTSSTSFFEGESTAISDATGLYSVYGYLLAPAIVAPIEINTDRDIFVQELRLVSRGANKIDYVLGAFYMKEDSLNIDEFDYFRGEGALLGNYLTGPGDLFLNLRRESEFEDVAAYGELTWHVNEKLDISVGMRVFRQDFTSSSFFDFPALGFYPGDVNDFDETDALYKANAAYALNDDTRVYATFSQGFRRGGANSIPTEGPFAESNELVSYDSDRVNNYEIGLKGTLAGRLRYSTAIFYVDWSDAQIGILTPNFGYDAAINAGDAETYGFEAELFGNLTDRLDYTLGYAYTQAELAEDFTGFIVGDEGAALPGVSEHTAFFSLDYRHPLSGSMEFIGHLDASYRSDFVNSIDPSQDIYREFDGFILAAAALTLESSQWSVSLFAENLTDDEGVSAQNEPSLSLPYHFVEWVTRPRTIGLRASYRF